MNNFDEIISSDVPTLVDFYAVWCAPCKMQAPILEQVKKQMGDKATILKIDVEQNQATASRYHVQAVPTILLFKNGEVKWRTTGVQQAGTLIAKIDELL